MNITRVKGLAKSKGISQSFICSKIGVGNAYLSQVATYNLNVSEDRIEKIAECLGTTVEYLTDQTDNPEPEQVTVEPMDADEKAVIEMLMELKKKNHQAFDEVASFIRFKSQERKENQ